MDTIKALQQFLFEEPDHIHDCGCGSWICMDETCEYDESRHGGYRECPFCGEE